jgi:F-type H+-transporting ATPase subunit a
MEAQLSSDATSLIVVVNSAVVGSALVAGGWWLAHRDLSVTKPGRVQNTGEAILDFFVGKARDMAHGPKRSRVIAIVTPLLAGFFIFILVSNLIGMIPMPVVNRPPTSHFGVTITLALIAVASTVVVSAAIKGGLAAVKHLFWPNPLEWISKISDTLSLSLRLFGNIAGEYLTLTLVIAVIPIGIPLILHALGMIPAFVQALVFTLLTASFLASSLHEEPKKERKKVPKGESEEMPAASVQEVATSV